MNVLRSDYKRAAAPLAVIGILALALSVASYQYSQVSLAAVSEIARDDVKNNAEIQARNLSTMFSTRLEAVDSNLQILSTSPSIRNIDDARLLLDVAQVSTEYLTRFYVVLDGEGTILASEAPNDRDYLDYLRAEDAAFFTVPRETLAPYVSGLVEIPGTATRNPIMFISYPILDPTQANPLDDSSPFAGVVAAAVDLNFTTQFAERSTASIRINSVEILDNDGTILYSPTDSLIGSNALSNELPWDVSASERASLSNFIAQTVDATPRTEEFTVAGVRSTIVSEPAFVNNQHLWTVYVTAPHTFSTDLTDLFNQQIFFSSLSIVAIGSVTVVMGLVILSWNKKLARIVDERTAELRKVNESLTESNAQLFALNEQLAANEKLQKEFINIASHEIKTPAQAILFHSELLKKQSGNAESLDAIKRNAERLQRLTNNILDVTRIESQNLKLNKEELNLKDIVSEVVNEYNDILQSKGDGDTDVRIVCQADDIIVTADRTRITQVLSNLLANAAEFTKDGEIAVSCERKDDQAIVQVRDCGPGIDPEIMPRLFTKFATKSDKGTGLGLFVSKNIVEAHGGRIWGENNKGKGATFAFSIPAMMVD